MDCPPKLESWALNLGLGRYGLNEIMWKVRHDVEALALESELGSKLASDSHLPLGRLISQSLSFLKWHVKLLMSIYLIRFLCRASLVVQWLRIHMPMLGTWVWALVREDPTYRGATKPMRHSYWTCALEPASHNYWACAPQLLKPTHLEPVLHNKRSYRNEKHTHRNEE